MHIHCFRKALYRVMRSIHNSFAQACARFHRRVAPIVDCIRKMRVEGLADNEIAGLFRHAADELDETTTSAKTRSAGPARNHPRCSSTDRGGEKRRREAGRSSRACLAALPIPICRSASVTGNASLDHFVTPPIARHDEGSEIAAAERRRTQPQCRTAVAVRACLKWPQSSSAFRFTSGTFGFLIFTQCGEFLRLLTVARQRIPTGAADLSPVGLQTSRNAQRVIGILVQRSLAKPFDILTARRTFLLVSLADWLSR
jgi:hypothetical protein